MDNLFDAVRKYFNPSKQVDSDFPYDLYEKNRRPQDPPPETYRGGHDVFAHEDHVMRPEDHGMRPEDVIIRHEDVIARLMEDMIGMHTFSPGEFGHSNGFTTDVEEEKFQVHSEDQLVNENFGRLFGKIFGNLRNFDSPSNPRDEMLKFDDSDDATSPRDQLRSPRDQFTSPRDQVTSPRDQLLKREDTDIDGQDLSPVLAERENRFMQEGQESQLMPWTSQNTFTSFSTSIKVNSDGSVQETRQYRDHTGRDETTTITREAQPGDTGSGLASLGSPLLGMWSLYRKFRPLE